MKGAGTAVQKIAERHGAQMSPLSILGVARHAATIHRTERPNSIRVAQSWLICGIYLGLSFAWQVPVRCRHLLRETRKRMAAGRVRNKLSDGLRDSSWSLGGRTVRAVMVSVAAAVWVLGFSPAWASGGFSSGAIRPVTGTFASRLSNYQAIFGSLLIDLAMGASAFVLFACCAGTETAITTLWPWKVRELAQREVMQAEQGNKRSGMWSALRADINRFMQTILIGSTISSVLSTAIVTQICGQLFGASGLAIATLSVTVGQLIFCEIVPKSVAVSNAYEFACITLPFYTSLSKVVYPMCRQLSHAVEQLLRCFGISIDASKTPYVSEEELDLMLKSAIQTGILETEEGKMISSVRELDSMRVNDIMIPLVDMVCVDAAEPIAKLHEIFSSTQYSRLPVYKDRFDNIVGVVSMKTLLRKVKFLVRDDWETVSVDQISDKPFFVPETMSVLNLLKYLKERPIAVCVDEYGGTTGLITLEDVLEEIVGEIYDPDVEKHELKRKRRSDQIECIAEGVYVMSAAVDIDDVSMELGVNLPEGNYNSIGGFMSDKTDRIPLEGEAVVVKTANMIVRFVATEVDERKVVLVQASKKILNTEVETASTGSKKADDDDSVLARVLEVTLEPQGQPGSGLQESNCPRGAATPELRTEQEHTV